MLTLAGINCKWSIKLNIYFLYWYFQQNQCLNIKNHAAYNIHVCIYQYGIPLLVRPPGNCPLYPCIKTALRTVTIILIIFKTSLVSTLMQSCMCFPHVIRMQIIKISMLKFLNYSIFVAFVWYFSSNHRHPHGNKKKRINKEYHPPLQTLNSCSVIPLKVKVEIQ